MRAALRAAIANEQALFLEEGMPVTVRRRGQGPGYRGASTGKFSGAFAATGRRIVASISDTIVVDAPYAARGTRGAEASLTNDGLHIKVDASVCAGFSGEIEMHFKHEFSEAELSTVERRRLEFDFQS